MQQQLAPAQRLVIRIAAMAVRTDVDVVEKHFAVFDAGEAVAQVHASFANRLDLGAEQHQPRLEALEQVEVVKGFPVFGDVRLCELAFGFFAQW